MTEISAPFASSAGAPTTPTLGQASKYWLKLGFISFGGPAGQIAMMHEELVEKRHWISEKRFLHALNYCMLLPGPEAQQLATYIGWLMHRTRGALIAGGLFVLPSLFILMALTWAYLSFGHVPLVAGVLYGIKPAVVAIVLAAAWRIGSRTLRNGVLIGIAAAAFAAIAFLHAPFPAIVLLAALIGIVGGKFFPQYFAANGHASANKQKNNTMLKNRARFVIDDETPPPPHAQFSWRKFWGVIAVSFALGLGVYFLLSPQPFLQTMARFFTQAALLTFGGAYAVLPYVFQGAVEQNHWLTASQMMDGLALGETTPGPLIMIVAFVGYVGGWSAQLFGIEQAGVSAALAACVTTFFTFLPNFMFILAGAPLIESTRGNLKFTAPLTAISAAVVGVILNLALFFGVQVFFPHSSQDVSILSHRLSHPDWLTCAIGISALIALLRFKANIMVVIAVSAVCGVVFL